MTIVATSATIKPNNHSHVLTAATTTTIVVTTAITTIAAYLQIQKLRSNHKGEKLTTTKEEEGDNEEVTTGAPPNWLYEYYHKKHPVIHVTLPQWMYTYYEQHEHDIFVTDDDMMKIAIEISHLNAIVHRTGGPFGCAIYRRNIETGQIQLYSVGANHVVSLRNSTLHAEMMAIQFAQYKLGHHSCERKDVYEYILVTSCEPCCMCLGGTLWSGVNTLLTGAAKADAEAIGFDEGPVTPASYEYLIERAHMTIRREVLRQDAANVLIEYGKIGVIY